jgi:hypothetical protein
MGLSPLPVPPCTRKARHNLVEGVHCRIHRRSEIAIAHFLAAFEIFLSRPQEICDCQPLKSEGFRRLMDQRAFGNGVKRSCIVPQNDEDHPGFYFLPRRCPNGTNDRGTANSHDSGRARNSSQRSVFESFARPTIPAIVG